MANRVFCFAMKCVGFVIVVGVCIWGMGRELGTEMFGGSTDA